MAEPRDNAHDEAQTVEISDEAIDRALERILEAERPFFNPAGTLVRPAVGRDGHPA